MGRGVKGDKVQFTADEPELEGLGDIGEEEGAGVSSCPSLAESCARIRGAGEGNGTQVS